MSHWAYHHTYTCALALCLGPAKDYATAAQLFDSIGETERATWARQQAEGEQRKARYTDVVSDGGMDPRDRAITEFYSDRANGSHAAKAP